MSIRTYVRMRHFSLWTAGIVRDVIWPPLWTGCLFVDDSVKSQLGCGFFMITHTETPWVHSVLKSPAPFTVSMYIQCVLSSVLLFRIIVYTLVTMATGSIYVYMYICAVRRLRPRDQFMPGVKWTRWPPFA